MIEYTNKTQIDLGVLYSVSDWSAPIVLLTSNNTQSMRDKNENKNDCMHLCYREWVETSYVDLKKANPKFPILIRECSGVQPKIYARYGKLD